ncbi:MAG: LPS assembly lipoprotein LptE [Verrucomicrobiota bacterium]|nr:LPS assembly lipoprotein LptE [Verrucomicrobiota bacterium]
MKKLLALAGLSFGLAGCLGYHVGPIKPHYLSDVHALAVPNFANKTLTPQVEVLITDAVIQKLQRDGTYRVTEPSSADAILKGDIVRIARSPARSVRGNVLATTEFNLTITLRYSLVSSTGAQLSPPHEVTGSTSFFVGNDVVSDERQAIPLAAEDLAQKVVVEVSEGW